MWRRFGPYHHARLRASAARFQAEGAKLIGLEIAAHAGLHQWRRDGGGAEVITLFPDDRVETLARRRIFVSVQSFLDRIEPDAVVVPAYSTPEAQAGLVWARDRRRPAVVMTATGRQDAPRSPWRERVKHAIVSQFDAALAGGSPQARYIRELGIPNERIFTPYNVVDNDFFAREASIARSNPAAYRHLPGLGSGRSFFIASGRFIECKNFATLLHAYAWYRRSEHADDPWDLIILGDGPMRVDLAALAGDIAPPGAVTLAGYRQIDEIAAYYALAGALVHASTVDAWGLVVNEAMAAGLPVLVSRTAGAAEDLVADGVNGFTFDPADPRQIADRMRHVAAPGTDRRTMGQLSRERVSRWSLARFADGLWRAVGAAASSADRTLPAGVRLFIWANQVAPPRLLRGGSVEKP